MNKIILLIFSQLILIAFNACAQGDVQWFLKAYPESKNYPSQLYESFKILEEDSLISLSNQELAISALKFVDSKGIRKVDVSEYHLYYLEQIVAYNILKKKYNVNYEQIYIYAKTLVEVGLYDRAIYFFSRSIDKYDADLGLILDLGDIFHERAKSKLLKNDYYGAISDCERALSSNVPQLENCYFLIGKAYLKLEKPIKAYDSLTKCIKEDEDYLEAYYLRAFASLYLGKIEDACLDISTLGDKGFDNNELLKEYCN